MPVIAAMDSDSADERVDRAFLVLLHVLGIGERQALHHDQHAH